MKIAKIILLVIIPLAVVAGAFAVKAGKFNGNPVWRYTLTITLPEGVYSSTRSFCTSINNTQYLTTCAGFNTVTLTSTAGPVSTITLTDGMGHTLSIPFTSCTTKLTCTTTLD